MGNIWAVYNGVGSKIYTSIDKRDWTEVGIIPNGFGNSIITIDIRPTKAKYVRFQHNNYLGLGFFKAEGSLSNSLDMRGSMTIGSSIPNNMFGGIQGIHPSFSNFTFTGPYLYNGRQAGTNELANVADRSLQNGNNNHSYLYNYIIGICCNSPGVIIFQLNFPRSISVIEIGGYIGNKNIWYPANGCGASISTSLDKIQWNNVGVIPNNFGESIISVNVLQSSANFIKFESNTYIGFGYVGIVI